MAASVLGFEPCLIACHECGQLHRVNAVPERGGARCVRCGSGLYKAKRNSVERSLVLTVAALILFTLAVSFPFMSFALEGRVQEANLFTGVVELYRQGLWPLAALVLCVMVLFPLLKLLAGLYVLLPMWLDRRPAHAAGVFRLVETLHPWAMMEVFLLGVLVAYVKLVEMATVELGIALYSFAALIVVMVWSETSLDPRQVWDRLPVRGGRSRGGDSGVLVGCHACDLVCRVRPDEGGDHARCPRCGAALHRRKPNSLSRTAALVLTAAILYIPANVYPVMTVISFGKGTPDTILSGIRELFHAGMWPLALLVFFASITVPMLKLAGLSYLLLSVRRKSRWRLRDRTLLFRIIEAVGRWSMIDIFMISILVALVKLGTIATIEPGVGATSFAAVVIVTMIASMCFDPRLMWDAAEAEDGRARRSG
ncbi:MAG: paraquat-inducible protein A [Rhodospirillales bacterium]